ncbi:hypothetical protein PoMZ_13543 [Pyricularia oryzae]|uniref:Uncharacterized protein n=1 Tax=Pyricularia oryzae TaxID=318829 RepID=A0A4P7NVK1_PYROR|nr:hypothetical protein PoMZ_13543 [Pyricularia oryzae]
MLSLVFSTGKAKRDGSKSSKPAHLSSQQTLISHYQIFDNGYTNHSRRTAYPATTLKPYSFCKCPGTSSIFSYRLRKLCTQILAEDIHDSEEPRGLNGATYPHDAESEALSQSRMTVEGTKAMPDSEELFVKQQPAPATGFSPPASAAAISSTSATGGLPTLQTEVTPTKARRGKDREIGPPPAAAPPEATEILAVELGELHFFVSPSGTMLLKTLACFWGFLARRRNSGKRSLQG